MKNAGYLYVSCAAFLWGIISIFVSHMNTLGFATMDIVFFRSLVTAVLMCVYILLKDKNLFKINLRDIWIFIGSGVVSFVFFSFCYFTAMRLTSVSVAAVLLYTSPIFVMLFSCILFKERITKTKIIAVVFTFLGCVLTAGISGGGYHATAVGILCGLGSGIGYALYSVFGRYGVQKYSSVTVTAYTFIFAATSAAFFINPDTVISAARPNCLISILLLGLLTCFIPYLMYTKALRMMETGKAAVIAALEPVVATIVSIVYFGEGLQMSKVVGMLLVLVSIIILNKTE